MRAHLSILAALLKGKGLSQAEVANALGYKSQAMVSMMLRGVRPVGRQELELMCELAGVTVVSLAAMSDDLVLTKRPEALEGAAILDEIPAEQLAAVMGLLRAYRVPAGDR